MSKFSISFSSYTTFNTSVRSEEEEEDVLDDDDDDASDLSSISSVTVESGAPSSMDTASSFSGSSSMIPMTLTGTLSWLKHQFSVSNDDKSNLPQESEEEVEEEVVKEDESIRVFSVPLLWTCSSPAPAGTTPSTFSFSEVSDDEDVELRYEETILHTGYPLQRS
jgi:hypothetical protein